MIFVGGEIPGLYEWRQGKRAVHRGLLFWNLLVVTVIHANRFHHWEEQYITDASGSCHEHK